MIERFEDLQAATEALQRLVAIAKRDTGQSRLVADFLIAWWNAGAFGGFDFTHLWNVDAAIADDMLRVFYLISRTRCYPDSLGLDAEFRQLVINWRDPAPRKAAQS